jgi:hypothetical protein
MLAFTLLLLAVRASAYYELPFPRQHFDVAQLPLSLTRDELPFPPVVPQRSTLFAPPSKKKTVEPIIDKLTAEELEEDLRALTSFHTRSKHLPLLSYTLSDHHPQTLNLRCVRCLHCLDCVSTSGCRTVTRASSGCSRRSTRYAGCYQHIGSFFMVFKIADAAVNGGSKVEVVEFEHAFAQPSIVRSLCAHVS